MGSFGRYLNREFRLGMFLLGHENTSDFYISCWQKNRSVIPLLLFRTFLFLVCATVLVWSAIVDGDDATWLIYLTHWGLILITVTTGVGAFVSAKVFFRGPIDGSFGLPALFKIYWLLYNISIPTSFLITIFYWTLLSDLADDEDPDVLPDPVMAVLSHTVNSIAVLLLLCSSRHPSRLLHFYHTLVFCIIYLIFTIIYYFAGGAAPFGTAIYPGLDWAAPATASIMVVVVALLLVILHFVAVGLSVARDALAKRVRKDDSYKFEY